MVLKNIYGIRRHIAPKHWLFLQLQSFPHKIKTLIEPVLSCRSFYDTLLSFPSVYLSHTKGGWLCRHPGDKLEETRMRQNSGMYVYMFDLCHTLTWHSNLDLIGFSIGICCCQTNWMNSVVDSWSATWPWTLSFIYSWTWRFAGSANRAPRKQMAWIQFQLPLRCSHFQPESQDPLWEERKQTISTQFKIPK